LRDSLIEGFMEDKHIIEHQQYVIDTDANFRMQAIAADAALSHFRLTLSKKIAAEQQEEAERVPAEKEPVRPHEMLLRF
jgi:vanillate O-demethylase monooxygenase subunit